MNWMEKVKFGENGLVPAIIQDVTNNEVLMLGYMNREALEKTWETGKVWFYSRSRQKLWLKGETSGHFQLVKELLYDCDSDALLVKVEQVVAACHEGFRSCFHYQVTGEGQVLVKGEKIFDPVDTYKGQKGVMAEVLQELVAVLKDRKEHPQEGSYTSGLFQKGFDSILKKIGEEAGEVIIASKNQNKKEILHEVADLWFHSLVLLTAHGISPEEVGEVLEQRRRMPKGRDRKEG